MTWRKYTNKAETDNGSSLASVRIIFDYHADDSTEPRKGALLEVKDYTLGSGDSITLNPSDVALTQLVEGTDFTATTSNAKTAENIATAIGGVSGFDAKAEAGYEGGPWVSVYYNPATLTNMSSDDTAAWEWWTKNATNGTIMSVAQDNTGTVKHQPIYSDTHGLFSAFLNAPVTFDVTPEKSGYPVDITKTEELFLPAKPIKGIVPVQIVDSQQTGLAADSTGVKWTSDFVQKLAPQNINSATIRASWTASNTDSVTAIEVYDETTDSVLGSVSGNTGTDAEGSISGFTAGNSIIVRASVTTASTTGGATCDIIYAVLELTYKHL